MSLTGSSRARGDLTRILGQLDAYLALARDRSVLEQRHAPLSRWSFGQHLEHLALVDGGILDRLEAADAEPPGAGGATLIGRLVLRLGFIPRGRGKAPDFAAPPDEPEIGALAPKLERTQERFRALGEDLGRLESGGPLARHFAFGNLDGRQWLRFVAIHHHHHFKIIREIRRADGSS